MPRGVVATEALLKAVPLFRSLDAATLARLALATQRRALKSGERAFSRGDMPTGLYVVVYGEMRLLGRSRAGQARLSGVAGPGSSFGEPVMFLERPALVDAEAATDALLLHVSSEAVFAEIERSPRFARRVIAGLSQRIESLVQETERQALGSGRARLADYLLRQGGGAPDASFALPASKAATASHLRLTAEHFSRLLHELATAGLVRVAGRRITLLDVPQLRRLGAQLA